VTSVNLVLLDAKIVSLQLLNNEQSKSAAPFARIMLNTISSLFNSSSFASMEFMMIIIVTIGMRINWYS